MKHRLNAYKDGYKWITFCEICGQEEPKESDDCPGYSQFNKTYRLDNSKEIA